MEDVKNPQLIEEEKAAPLFRVEGNLIFVDLQDPIPNTKNDGGTVKTVKMRVPKIGDIPQLDIVTNGVNTQDGSIIVVGRAKQYLKAINLLAYDMLPHQINEISVRDFVTFRMVLGPFLASLTGL